MEGSGSWCVVSDRGSKGKKDGSDLPQTRDVTSAKDWDICADEISPVILAFRSKM